MGERPRRAGVVSPAREASRRHNRRPSEALHGREVPGSPSRGEETLGIQNRREQDEDTTTQMLPSIMSGSAVPRAARFVGRSARAGVVRRDPPCS